MILVCNKLIIRRGQILLGHTGLQVPNYHPSIYICLMMIAFAQKFRSICTAKCIPTLNNVAEQLSWPLSVSLLPRVCRDLFFATFSCILVLLSVNVALLFYCTIPACCVLLSPKVMSVITICSHTLPLAELKLIVWNITMYIIMALTVHI